MRRFYPYSAFAILAIALCSLAGAEERGPDGEWIEFYGWCPDSACYGYRVVRLETPGVDKPQRKRTEERYIKVPEKGRPGKKAFRGSLEKLAQRNGFVADPLPSERVDERTLRFPIGAEADLIFMTLVGKRLTYQVSLAEESTLREVGKGTYDDVYAATDAFAYLSPDGDKVAFVVYGQNPFRVRGEVHLMRLPSYRRAVLPPAPLPAAASGPDAGSSAPDAESAAAAPFADVPPPEPVGTGEVTAPSD